jgi:hypothetical protein
MVVFCGGGGVGEGVGLMRVVGGEAEGRVSWYGSDV